MKEKERSILNRKIFNYESFFIKKEERRKKSLIFEIQNERLLILIYSKSKYDLLRNRTLIKLLCFA